MACTVFAEKMGFFHKGSGGKGIAPGDVCMTPPPPPAGPIPVPYVNIAQASDLTKGSKTVKIDGEPTALEDVSEVSTSSGNEPGSQPPKGVVTATNKGKASFTLWSFTVKVEGKGVCRHGDPMFQNEMSTPPNCIDGAAMTKFKTAPGVIFGKKCARKYNGKKHRPSRRKKQADKVNGKACWECKRDLGFLKKKLAAGKKVATAVKRLESKIAAQSKKGSYMVHDHQPPLVVAWTMGGCHMGAAAFKKHFATAKSVKPHCFAHQRSQGSKAAKYARNMFKP
jgi:uncharacterized Zn-binding protein involved in type VI secretion